MMRTSTRRSFLQLGSVAVLGAPNRLLGEFNMTGMSEPEIDHFNHVWHR